MYGLETHTDLSELVGGALTFVGFGQYQLQLGFSGDLPCSISVEGHYRVADPTGEPVVYGDAVSGASALLPLLGRTVESATVPDDGTVRIVLDDASLIDLLDSSAEYESYQLTLGSRLIVV